jgi:hypothetical protein
MYMTKLSIFLGCLSHLFSKSAVRQQESCTIHRTSLLRIFQVENHELFKTSENVDTHRDNDIQSAIHEYAMMGSPVAAQLTDEEFTKVTFKSHSVRSDGASFIFLEYDHTAIESPKTTWATMMLSSPTTKDGQSAHIHFSLSGLYKLHNDGTLYFTPCESVCLTQQKDEYAHELATNDDEFRASIVYANQAILQFFTGRQIDTIENQKILEPHRADEVYDTCENLMRRTADTFKHDIALQKLSLKPQC